jgi:nicotinamide-nucleotide amidase
MRCDVLAVGTELLLGQIVDTNSAWLGEQLAAHGIDSLMQVKIGDNRRRIADELRLMLADADAVIVCGGLGPTQDDITRDVIADIMGVPLERDEQLVDKIRNIFGGRGRPMPENNLRQADVPVGATIIPQTRGTAPGLICPVKVGDVDKVVFAVPGVPPEVREMFERGIWPELQRRGDDGAIIVSRVLRTWGESESGLNERLDGVIAELDALGNPTLAFLASGWDGLKIRLTGKAESEAECEILLDEWEGRVRDVVGELVFGVDGDSMESVVLDMLRTKGWSLGLAESVTGGLVAARLTEIPGASEVFRGSVVSYATEVKQQVLDVPEGPVVSEDAALAMARGASKVLASDVTMALTGVAGPTEQDGMPAGTLCVAIVWPEGELTRTFRLPGQRQQMRQFSVINSLDLLRRTLCNDQPGSVPTSG